MTGAGDARWGIVGGRTNGREMLFVSDMGSVTATMCYVLVKPVETLSEAEGRYWTRSDDNLRKDIGVEQIHFVMADVFDWRSMTVGELLANARIES